MKRKLITSLVYFFPNADECTRSNILGMLDIWAKHIRGTGCFDGDVIVYSNDDSVSHPLVEVAPFNNVCEDVKEMFLQRIMNYEAVQEGNYDSILNLDLDILAVSDINDLFVNTSTLHAATSQMQVSHPRHAGHFMSLLERWYSLRFHPVGRKLGVNCCAFSCSGSGWHETMSDWCKVIDSLGGVKAKLPLGDQTTLNQALLKNTFPIKRYPQNWIHHSNWKMTDDVKLWHFPTPDRLRVMREHSLL